MDNGDKVTGCTVHHVTKQLDSGAIIEQSKVPIAPDDTVETLTRKIQLKEYAILPYVIDNWSIK